MNKRQIAATTAIALMSLVGAACAKKVAATNPPAPPAAAPVAQTPARTESAPANRVAPSTPRASAPAPNYPDAATRARIDQLLARISDAYFDYDKFSLRDDAVKTLRTNAVELRNILAQYPGYNLQIEGYCDERGSAEYNMALGDRRAAAAKTYLVDIGIPSGQLSVVSYGKERSICDEHDEACWQKNRRIHIIALAK
jgi:peptidoglycan-associated lipoprotein